MNIRISPKGCSMPPEVCRSGCGGGRLQGDAEQPARRPEVLRDEHLPVIAHDRLRHDHRPGRGVLQPLVQLQQPPVRQHRAGHAQRRSPARPHRLRGHGPGQQQGRVHRLGRRPQHRRGDRTGGQVHHARQLRPARHPAVQQHHARRTGWSRSAPAHPAAAAATWPNGPPGRLASDWRVRADPVVCRPAGPARTAGRTSPGRHRRPRRPVLFGQDLPGPPLLEAAVRVDPPACS